VPQLERLGHREHADRSDRGASDPVREHQHDPALEAVADRAAEQQEQHLWEHPGDTDDRKRRGRVGERVDLPGDRDRVETVAEERHGHPGPKEREVADP
jgi:hypothetical protein